MAELVKKCPEYNQRAAIVESLRTGRTMPKIIRFFGYPKSTVYDFVRRYAASEGSEEGSYTPRTKFPTSVHVLSVVSSEGDIISPHFFQKGENVTKDVYLKILQTVVKSWIDIVASGRPYVFQQDGAPAHTSHLVQNWLCDNMSMFWSKEFWPPNNPDLNPLDYFVWSVIERHSNKTRHPNVASLKAAIEASFASMEKILAKARARFRPRIETVIEVKGGYIE
jgi:hypothetical protein